MQISPNLRATSSQLIAAIARISVFFLSLFLIVEWQCGLVLIWSCTAKFCSFACKFHKKCRKTQILNDTYQTSCLHQGLHTPALKLKRLSACASKKVKRRSKNILFMSKYNVVNRSGTLNEPLKWKRPNFCRTFWWPILVVLIYVITSVLSCKKGPETNFLVIAAPDLKYLLTTLFEF